LIALAPLALFAAPERASSSSAGSLRSLRFVVQTPARRERLLIALAALASLRRADARAPLPLIGLAALALFAAL
jgi:hypothetical protein